MQDKKSQLILEIADDAVPELATNPSPRSIVSLTVLCLFAFDSGNFYFVVHFTDKVKANDGSWLEINAAVKIRQPECERHSPL